MTNKDETVKRLADAYVLNIASQSGEQNGQRWFPQHEDDVVRKAKWFHEELGNVWRDSTNRA